MNRVEILAGFLALSSVLPAFSVPIPPDRRVDGRGVVTPEGNPTHPEGVSVKDFGAIGDGTADDTAAIQSAIDACPAGRAVAIPAGRYRTTARLIVSKGITLRGDGPSRSWILQDSTDATIRFVGRSGGGPSGSPVGVTAGYDKGPIAAVVTDASSFASGDYVGTYQAIGISFLALGLYAGGEGIVKDVD